MKSVYFSLIAFALSLSLCVTESYAIVIPGDANLWLAGMPNGSTDGPDTAPNESPVNITGLLLIPNGILTFDVSGSVLNQPGTPIHTPDGGGITQHDSGTGNPVNGISGLVAPINSLLGVFLDDSQPDTSGPPSGLDFSSPASREFLQLMPVLKQSFFIGDGRTSASDIHQFVIPAGATRLFLGTMDGGGWFNNIGAFDVDVTLIPPISTIPEPLTTSMSLIGFGILSLTIHRRIVA